MDWKHSVGSLLIGAGLFLVPAAVWVLVPPSFWLQCGLTIAGGVVALVGTLLRGDSLAVIGLALGGLALVIPLALMFNFVQENFGLLGMIVLVVAGGWWANREFSKVDD